MSDQPAQPYLLAIDTSGALPGAAVAGPAGVMAEACVDEPRRGAEALGACVRAALGEAGIGIESIGVLAVVRGPGSFTGIRVGLALARGLALVEDLPAIGVDSLDVLVHAAGDVDRRLCAVLGAAQDKVYAAGYQRDGDHVKRTRVTELLELSELDPMITEWGGRVVLCAERATLDVLRAAQAAKIPDRLVTVPDARARHLAEVAYRRLDDAESIGSILPLYVAEPAARPNRNRVAASSGGRV